MTACTTRIARSVGVMLLAAAALAPAMAEEMILVEVDRAKVLRLEEPAATIVLGNPAIADAVVQDRTMLIVTGKSFGATNLIVLDAAGETVAEALLQVRPASQGLVTIQRGQERLSYSCAPTCERTLSVGDSPESFSTLNQQIQGRIDLSRGQASQ